MNDLRYVGTDNGNEVLFYPHAGHEFYFEKIDYRTLTLKRVIPVESVEQIWDASTDYIDLPKQVRAVLKQNHYRYRTTAETAAEAMA